MTGEDDDVSDSYWDLKLGLGEPISLPRHVAETRYRFTYLEIVDLIYVSFEI